MAVLTPQPKMQFTTAAGVPLSGGKVYTYTAGTTTPQATFTDYTGATPNANPVILDSRGEANIWLGAALYKFKLTDANDVEIWTVDYISAPTSGVSPVLSGNVVIDSDTPGPALKITQTGTGPVLRVQDSTDPDATPFIIDNSGNVGIGTLTPTSKLTVSNSTVNVDVSPISTVGYVGTQTNHDLALMTNNTERVRIDASGNVGVNTAVPSARFDLSGDYREGVVTANTGTAYTISLAAGTIQILTLTGNCTFTFPSVSPAGRSFMLLLRQDAPGSRTATWPVTVRWPSGASPVLTTTGSRTDKFVFTSDGTNWLGSNAGQNYAP